MLALFFDRPEPSPLWSLLVFTIVVGIALGLGGQLRSATGATSTSQVLAAIPAPTATSTDGAVAAPSSFDTLKAISARVVHVTNEIRRTYGLSTVDRDPDLAVVGCHHTADMFRRDFFKHRNPDGESPQDRVARLHRRLIGGVSENLYEQSGRRRGPSALAREIVDQWMNSRPHRENILSPHATHVGVCTLREQDTIRATQVFAKVVAYLTPPMPDTVRPGIELPISFRSPGAVDAAVAKYDVWDDRVHRAITEPSIVTDSLSIPDTTGTFRSRFYVVELGKYVLYQGPTLTIAEPS